MGIPATHTYMGGGLVTEDPAWLIEESEEHLRDFVKLVEPMIHQTQSSFIPEIRYQNVPGNIEKVVGHILSQNPIELIVMGAKSGSFIEHILIGSETRSVIDHATRPVVIIPPAADLKKLQEVVFATDFSELDMGAIDYLVNLGAQLKYKLKIIHVNTSGEKHHVFTAEAAEFRKRLKTKHPDIVYEELRGQQVTERLNKLCENTGVNLLALIHYQHSFIIRMLLKSTTKHALSDQKIPLLVIPSHMDFNHEST